MLDILDVSLLDPSNHPDEARGVPSFVGVTRTLSTAGVISPFEVTQDILNRGSEVHLATKYYDQKDFDRRTLPHNRRGYLNAWKKFRDENRFDPQLIEHYVEDKTLGVRGTLDRAGPMPGIKSVPWAIVEVATGTALPFKRLQTAIYGYMLNRKKTFRRIAVELHEDATYHITEYPVLEYWPDIHTFLACTRVNAFRRKYGL